jgi:hypothetical protein
VKRFLVILAAVGLCACASHKKSPTTAAPHGVVTSSAPTIGSQAPKAKKLSPYNPFNWPKLLFPKKKQPPQALPPARLGAIAFIDQENKFVLIDAETLAGAVPGEPLVCISNQNETGTLRLSTLRNPPFLVADIIGGNPQKGDLVYKR